MKVGGDCRFGHATRGHARANWRSLGGRNRPNLHTGHGLGALPNKGRSNVRTFDTLADLASCVGETVATSEWLTVTQQHIDLFAMATGDHQWIHTDVARAASGPFGTTIAHGFLTLSLLPQMMESAVHITHSSMGVNLGLNKVRFTSPVPVDSCLRAHLRLLSLDWIEQGGCQMAWGVTVERQGQDKPVCVAEILARRYP